MDMQAYIDEIKFKLTGGVLELEIEDSVIEKQVLASFRELQRYISTPKLATMPFSRCIDLSNCGVSTVVKVYRTEGYLANGGEEDGNITAWVDPMQAAQWQWLSGAGSLQNYTEYIYNYAGWNTLLQIRNTTSTDLSFRYDKVAEKLYINTSYNNPTSITIEYIPRYNDVSEIVSDYWIDKLARLSLANTKVVLGRIRTRYTQDGAPWGMDGQTLLEEGNAELQEIREGLVENKVSTYPID